MSTARVKITDELNKFHFEKPVDDAGMPYREQGSTLFDNPEMQEMRRAIRSSAKIRSASLQFWTAAGLTAEQAMTFETYAYIHRRISKALAPELSDEEAQEAAADEWLEDLDGDEPDNGLAFDRYAKGLFGIADMWTEKVDELEYVIFINKLYRRITILRDQRVAMPGVAGLASSAGDNFSSTMPHPSTEHLPGSRPTRVRSVSEGAKGAFGGLANVAGSLLEAAKLMMPSSPPTVVTVEGATPARSNAFGTPVGGAASAAGNGASGGSSVGPGSKRRMRSQKMIMQRSESLWRGVLPTFRAYRELDEIVPLTGPATIKPEPRVPQDGGSSWTPARRTVAGAPGSKSKRSGSTAKKQMRRRITLEGGAVALSISQLDAVRTAPEHDSAGDGAAAHEDRQRSNADGENDSSSGGHGEHALGQSEAGEKSQGSLFGRPTVTVPSEDDDEDDEGHDAIPESMPSFSLKRRGESGWVDGAGNAIRTPRSLLRQAAQKRTTFDSPLLTEREPASPAVRGSALSSGRGRPTPSSRRVQLRTPSRDHEMRFAGGVVLRTPREGNYRKGSPFPRSPARAEGGAQSDGDEEVVERRSFLDQTLRRNAAMGVAARKDIKSVSQELISGATSSGAGLRSVYSYSDDEEDAAYVAMQPLKIMAKSTQIIGKREEESQEAPSMAELGAAAAARRARERQLAAVTASPPSPGDDDAEADGDDEAEKLKTPTLLPDGKRSLTAPGWGEEPPARSRWWRAREKARQEEIRQKPDSIAAEMEARREQLQRKSLSLFRPLPRLGILSPLSRGSPASASSPSTPSALTPAAHGPSTATPGSGALNSPLPSSPRSSITSSVKSLINRRRRYTHDGSVGGNAPLPSPSNFDADAAAVFRNTVVRSHGGDGASCGHDNHSTLGKPIDLSGSGAFLSRPSKEGIAASLGAEHTMARHIELRDLTRSTKLPMYGAR